MVTQAIIPLAGLGTRLLPLSSVIPKELLPINGKPNLEYIMEECIQAGIKQFIFVVPKNSKSDIKILKKLKVNYLYKPSFSDIYKFKTKNKIFLHSFSNKLCGKFRKNHFKGVVNAVNRLAEIIKPKRILLGLKDFQQLRLIEEHVKKNKINIKIVRCKTIRDKNFIAYSSRLERLKKNEKKILNKVIKFLKIYKKNLILKKNKHNFLIIKNKLLSFGVKKVDYVEIIDLKTLKKPKKNKFNLFFAFNIGKIRFIDNF